MLKIRGVFLLLSLLSVQGVVAQSDNLVKRYLNNVLSESGDPSAPKLINYPTVAYAPETSWELGVSSLYVYS
ncbi:MAG: hypothetical protein ACPGYN_06700, partial [Schleiferiaceae bacterium]